MHYTVHIKTVVDLKEAVCCCNLKDLWTFGDNLFTDGTFEFFSNNFLFGHVAEVQGPGVDFLKNYLKNLYALSVDG
jgi:hypothetical protein